MMSNRDLERGYDFDKRSIVPRRKNRKRARREDNGSANDVLAALQYAFGGLAENDFDGANFKRRQQAENNASQASLHINEIDTNGEFRMVNVFSGSADVTIDRIDTNGDAQIVNLFLDDETIARLRQIQPANHSTEVDLREY